MSEALLGWVPEYGLPALFVTLAVAAFGLPLPGTLLLVAVGALVSQGELPLWPVLVTAAFAAVLGDQAGYILGRWGSGRVIERIEARAGAAEGLGRAQALANRWGAASVFFTRWLVGPLGPWVNLSSGIASYSWSRFLVWDVLGEVVWVGLYVTAGMVLSDRVTAIADFSSNLAWAIVGLVFAALCMWWLHRHAQRTHVTGSALGSLHQR